MGEKVGVQNRAAIPANLRERFAQLLDSFSGVAARDHTAVGLSTVRIRTLLERFVELRNSSDASARAHAADDYKTISALLAGYSEAVERYGRQQEQVADDFNLLDVMRLTGKEVRHSMVLTWLLDHDIRKLGTHAQGKLGFLLFLREFSDFNLPLVYADCTYWVQREVTGNGRKRGQGTFLLPVHCPAPIIILMPRGARDSQGGWCYHVLNRGNGRRTVFRKDGDFAALVKLLGEVGKRIDVRLLAYCLTPNHFHLALWPRCDGDLSHYMMWLTTAHVRRYIERNPVRAGLVKRAEDWLWSSASAARAGLPLLDAGPVPHPADWLRDVNEPQTQAEVERLRECLRRRRPFGDESWTQQTARRMDLEASLRPRGRPRKKSSPEAALFGGDDAAD